jgi:hypothetical protein
MFHRPSYLARAYLYYLVLTGSIRFDWDWLLPIQLDIWKMLAHFHLDLGLPTLLEEAVKLGYSRVHATQSLKWVLCRVFLHEPYAVLGPRVGTGALELIEAVRQFSTRPDLPQLYGSVEQYHRQRRGYQSHMHLAHVVLYHSGYTPIEPHRIMPLYAGRPGLKPRMEAVVTKYLASRRLTHAPNTVEKMHLTLRHFGAFLEQTYPEVETFAQVTREHILAWASALETMPMPRTGQPLAAWSKIRVPIATGQKSTLRTKD